MKLLTEVKRKKAIKWIARAATSKESRRHVPAGTQLTDKR